MPAITLRSLRSDLAYKLDQLEVRAAVLERDVRNSMPVDLPPRTEPFGRRVASTVSVIVGAAVRLVRASFAWIVRAIQPQLGLCTSRRSRLPQRCTHVRRVCERGGARVGACAADYGAARVALRSASGTGGLRLYRHRAHGVDIDRVLFLDGGRVIRLCHDAQGAAPDWQN